MKSKKRAVLVTTAHRGVFFGYSDVTTEKVAFLENCRMAVYWSADLRGVLGLASEGPSSSCRIGPPSRGWIQDITAVFEVDPGAAKKWEDAPWSK